MKLSSMTTAAALVTLLACSPAKALSFKYECESNTRSRTHVDLYVNLKTHTVMVTGQLGGVFKIAHAYGGNNYVSNRFGHRDPVATLSQVEFEDDSGSRHYLNVTNYGYLYEASGRTYNCNEQLIEGVWVE